MRETQLIVSSPMVYDSRPQLTEQLDQPPHHLPQISLEDSINSEEDSHNSVEAGSRQGMPNQQLVTELDRMLA